MSYFKYIFFFLIFNFSISGGYSDVRYNPLNYLRGTESVIDRLSQQDFNKAYFWRQNSISRNNFQIFIFSFEDFQIYVDNLSNYRFLNQNKLFDKLETPKKEILKYIQPRFTAEKAIDLCKMTGIKTSTCDVCKKLHAMKISNSNFQIFQKCINQRIKASGLFKESYQYLSG